MSDHVESRVRRVVAESLGVDADDLVADVSLVDDLAADSLDLVELVIGLEGELDIVFPESAVYELRTYGDLVDTVRTLRHGRRPATPDDGAAPPLVCARVLPPTADAEVRNLQRVGWLTPYTAEIISEDALRAGRGARLEVTVPSSVNDAGLARLQDQFSWLGDRGVQVSVRRDRHLGPRRYPSRPHAAA
jgi:acyl carrier protein